jgi:hypothetical protein
VVELLNIDDPYVGIEEPLMYDVQADAYKPTLAQLIQTSAKIDKVIYSFQCCWLRIGNYSGLCMMWS